MLLIFDLFGTLVDVRPINSRLWRFFTIYAGVDVSYQEFMDVYLSLYRETFSGLGRMDYIPERYLFDQMFGRLLAKFGVRRSPEFITAYLYGLLASLPPFEDVGVLGSLGEAGHTLWVLSNSDSEYSVPLVHSLGLPVAGITTAAMARAYKPNPQIYALAVDSAGYEPTDAVMIGDSLSDVEGAEAFGIRGILLDRDGRYGDYQGLKIENLWQLEEVLEKL